MPLTSLTLRAEPFHRDKVTTLVPEWLEYYRALRYVPTCLRTCMTTSTSQKCEKQSPRPTLNPKSSTSICANPTQHKLSA